MATNNSSNFGNNTGCMRRTKLVLIQAIKNEIFCAKMKNNYNFLRRIVLLVSIIIIVVIILFAILVIFVLYPEIEKKEKFRGQALFCSIEIYIGTSYVIGGLGFTLLILALICIIAHQEFEQLSRELFLIKRIDSDLQKKVTEFMLHHEELWLFMQQFNTKYNLVVVIIYFFVLWGTSYFCYAFIFLEFHYYQKYIIFLLMVIFTCICVIAGCLLCSLAFTMENTFQDVRQFAGCDIGLKRKLKILDFMKRFGKVSLSLSIGGFFVVDKRIVFKMASTLHSIFSGFLKLKTVSNKKENCEQMYKFNYTKTT
ncbi:uncharacterized protein LOC111628086 [Centruroides sculpturatus]|uniref:uncharacterized protein LOC111628086 n=1 Tax=Centruroides sculpturatus TaxID=218467 RepID=UPI000C6C8E94|nr:uncharacterized protein LOC111628086 [Centruroides sculpturatus]